ncbi:MAG: response regulator [Lachnospiraceae bacterium]|nr:response regulator [Lachnospiraceae bacterium]
MGFLDSLGSTGMDPLGASGGNRTAGNSFKKEPNHVLVISAKEAFISKALQKNLRDAGYEVSYSPANVESISQYHESANTYILYMDEDMRDNMKLLVYLKDVSAENDKIVILIGTVDEYNLATSVMNKDHLAAWFERPIDMHALLDKVSMLTDKQAMENRKKSILVVDDDVTYLRMVHSWLKDQYRVSIVNSGMQAITWLARNPVDLVLLDYEMPVTSGPSVLEMLKSEIGTSDIPVMFLTGKSDKASISKVIGLRPERYLLKTISREELLDEINRFFVGRDNLF